MRKVFSLLVLAFLLIGCKKDVDLDCTTVLPPPNWFEFSINSSGGTQLINNVYVRDSFRFYSATSNMYLKPLEFAGDPSYLYVAFPDLKSGEQYYIDLSDTETDSMIFNFTKTEYPCYTGYSFSEIIYNGYSTQIDGESRRYNVTKY